MAQPLALSPQPPSGPGPAFQDPPTPPAQVEATRPQGATNGRPISRDNLSRAYTSAFCTHGLRHRLGGRDLQRVGARWKDSPARVAARKSRVALGMAERVCDDLERAGVDLDRFQSAFDAERVNRGR